MKLIEKIMTNNPCYQKGERIKVKGLMLHSVGCSQPSALAFIRTWDTPSYNRACVHGFIDANTGDVYQTLPWDYRGWHAGGNANNTHIGIEMCEPACIKYTGGDAFICSNVEEARKAAIITYEAAVDLFALLCGLFQLDPLEEGVIVSHSEGYKRGTASEHSDPEHIWRQLELPYSMNSFRLAISQKLEVKLADNPEKYIWDYLLSRINNPYGVAGLMGNLYAESGLKPKNLQNSYNKKLNISDEDYTQLVDGNNYPDFITDKAGYGLAQWTYYTRKQALINFARKRNKSIGDLDMQLEFLVEEISGYKAVYHSIKEATSVEEAAEAVLIGYEKPANQGDTVKKKRAQYGQNYFDKYHVATDTDGVFRVRVSIKDLNIRKGPGTNYETVGKYTGIGVFTIVETNMGKGAKLGWGKLKSGLGWVSLDYCKRI